MIVTPLPGRPTATRDALLSHGWEGDVCRDTAFGMAPAGYHVTGLDSSAIEAMLPVAARLGLELVTGDDWIILAGAMSRLGAFARPWVQPAPVRELAIAIGMAMPGIASPRWAVAGRIVDLPEPLLMGIVNVTPDSFSDGNELRSVDDVLRHVEWLAGGGATIVDVGGESTRPGALPLDATIEAGRVLPAVEAIARARPDLVLSVDTVRADLARRALDAGAHVINDVTGGRHDDRMRALIASTGAGFVVTHSRGAIGSLANDAHADFEGDVVGTVSRELAVAVDAARAAGVRDDQMVIDPGFGFGKRAEHNFRLLDDLEVFSRGAHPVLVAVSRKRFIGAASGRAVDDRDRATAAACAIAVERGASVLRVHDPHAARDAVAVAAAVRRSRA